MLKKEIQGKSNNDNSDNAVTQPADSTRTTKATSDKNKSSQENITTEYFDNLHGMLRRRVQRCEEEAKSAYEDKRGIGIEDINDNPDLIKDFKGYLYWYKSKVIE